MASLQHPPCTPASPPALWQRLARLARHRWAEGTLRQTFTPDLLARLTERVAASEQRHTGQIRLCVEAGLPLSYLWRGASARERAVAQFGRLRVWDTERNNGVLIYLLQAEHGIEIVADRGLACAVPAETWQRMVAAMGEAFRAGRHEAGLVQAIAEVSALLERHFPARAPGGRHGNELPDSPVIGDGR